MEENLIIINDLEMLGMLKEYVSNPDFNYVAYDTETTGLDLDAEVVGFSICAEEHVGIYVILAEWHHTVSHEACTKCPPIVLTKKGVPKKQRACKACGGSLMVTNRTGELKYNRELKAASKEILEILKTKSLIMHNAVFDCRVTTREFGIELMPAVHTDTMILAHLLNENDSIGLKPLALRLFGETATAEQKEMKSSVLKNGGIWQESKDGIKEMYKADPEILGKYGAKDTILTYRVFQALLPQLFEENLDKFFYEDESMPLLKGPTYEMNTVGMRADVPGLLETNKILLDECVKLKAEILEEIFPKIKDLYPMVNGQTKFNIGSSSKMAWLLFIRLGHEFNKLTDKGRELAKELIDRIPYSLTDKRRFIKAVYERRKDLEDQFSIEENPEMRKALSKAMNKMVPEKYLKCDKDTLTDFAVRYSWVAKLLRYSKNKKLSSTYCLGISEKVRYGIIHPTFKQTGTNAGRYSSSDPNFQNLPKNDKRIKKCILAREGRVFVGADYSQLEPRVFASVSQDPALLDCFKTGKDFYSVTGVPMFKDFSYSLYKDEKGSWADAFPKKRDLSKAFSLATAYGTTASQQSEKLRDQEGNRLSREECQIYIDSYFEAYPLVQQMMIDSHQRAMRDGVVYNLYGRPRRLPEAMEIPKIFGEDITHAELPYSARNVLNQAMNFTVQSSGASIVNRAMIALYQRFQELQLDAKIVLQVHDEIVVECREQDKEIVARELKNAMENTTKLPGVSLIAKPVIAYNLADLK